MEAIRYIVDMLLWLLLLAFMLRFIFQLVRADFRDPMADAIVRVTNWLILPLRRVLPPAGKVDTATIFAILLIAVLRTVILFAISGVPLTDGLFLTRYTLIALIDMVLQDLFVCVADLLADELHRPGRPCAGRTPAVADLRTGLEAGPPPHSSDRSDRLLGAVGVDPDRCAAGRDPLKQAVEA